jgi:hypothetical protein
VTADPIPVRVRAELRPGDMVTIDAGRHRGETGIFLGYDAIQSGQLQLYPRVALSGTQQEVRVRSVTAARLATGTEDS